MPRGTGQVDVAVRHPRGGTAGRLLASAGQEFLRRLDVDAELSVVVTTDRHIHLLNQTYRDIDRPTDVLSFPADGERLLGDVVISLDTARREARARGLPLSHELRRYLAHGILHLLGHDHHRAADARRMAAWEQKLLGRSGMVHDALGARSVPGRRAVKPPLPAARRSGRVPS